MYDKGVFTISNFQKGSAVSPYLGFGNLIACDISSSAGVVKCSTSLGQVGTITPVGLPVAFANGNQFVGTNSGKVYKNGTLIGTTTSGTAVHDMVIYKDYLIITQATFQVDTYGPLSSAPSWHANILSLGTTATYGYRKMVLNTTDPVIGVLIANEGYIASISSSFTGTADASFNATDFTLPSGRVATTICEYGDDLAIMTKDTSGIRAASIIFWDKAATYGTNIFLSEITANQMIALNNRLYYVGNDTGTLYEANKSSFLAIWSIQNRRSWQTFSNYPNAICVAQKQILFGFTAGQTSNPDPVYYGVYQYTPNGGVSIRNTISTGNYGLSQNLTIGALVAITQGVYYAGWQDGSTVGVDSANISLYATAKIEGQFAQVGGVINKKSFKEIEIILGETFPAGASILVKYRTSMTDDYTLLKTYTQAVIGSKTRISDSFGISDLTTFQPEIDLVPGTGLATTPVLLSAMIK